MGFMHEFAFRVTRARDTTSPYTQMDLVHDLDSCTLTVWTGTVEGTSLKDVSDAAHDHMTQDHNWS